MVSDAVDEPGRAAIGEKGADWHVTWSNKVRQFSANKKAQGKLNDGCGDGQWTMAFGLVFLEMLGLV